MGRSWQVLVPTLVGGPLDARRVSVVACSYYHSVAFAQGELFGFGRNDYGQLGLGDTVDRLTPTRIEGCSGKEVVSLACVGTLQMGTLTQTPCDRGWTPRQNALVPVPCASSPRP